MLTVIAYATEKQAYFDLFMESCQRFGIDPVILGWGDRWIGSGEKLISICKFIQNLPADDLILSVDPFDVIFLAESGEIEEKFWNLNIPFLCGALKLRSFNARVYDHEFNHTSLSIPERDMLNYTRKAYFHLGKILKYALIPKARIAWA